MKVFKKLSMLFVAAAMMMTTVSTAFAAEETATPGNGSLTINGDNTEYVAYRVLDSNNKKINGSETIELFNVNSAFKNFFTGGNYSFEKDKGILENGEEVELGEGLFTKAEDTKNGTKNNYAQSAAMERLTTALTEFSLNANNKVSGTTFKSGEKQGLQQGYYLVLENAKTITSGNVNTKRTPSKAMLIKISSDNAGFVIKDGEVNTIDRVINPKDAEIKVTKTANGAPANVAGIGDDIEYVVESTIPTYAANYTNIKYYLSDKMSIGLSLNGDLKIEVAGTTVYECEYKDDESVVKTNTANYFKDGFPKLDKDKGTIDIDFNYDALKSAAAAGKTVKLTYHATINNKATINENSNENDVELKYTNNPDGSTDGIKTNTDTYTYGIEIKKVDGNDTSKTLNGATFKIQKVLDNNARQDVDEKTITENGLIGFNGLGAGTYAISEVKAPDGGYVKLDGEILITITPSEDKKSATVEISNTNGKIAELITVEGNAAINDQGQHMIQISNYKGINLPETGGMGTTIFMIGGAALIALAGVMLVVYSKKSKKA